MTPVNSKSLFTFICNQMEMLDKDVITVEKAKAQSALAKQANNLLKYELDRASTEITVRNFNKDNKDDTIRIREIESKPFDNTI